MEKKEGNILGCFVSGPTINYDANQKEEELADEQGRLFRSYIWGDKGIDSSLKKLKCQDYGADLILILFQFYLKPLPIELQDMKEIENYRKKEKAIGIPVIVTDENFYDQSETGRFDFIKSSILQKLDLLAEVVKKKKLDTNIESLKTDFQKLFD